MGPETQDHSVIPRNPRNAVLYARRVLTYFDTKTAATGVVNATEYTSGAAPSCDEWGAYSAAFQEYRVRAMRMDIIPRINQAVAAIYLDASAILTATFFGKTTGPSTVAGFVGQSGFTFNPAFPPLQPGGRCITVECDHRSNPSADLWASTNGAVTTLSLMGVAARQVAAASAAFNGIVVWDILLRLDCEFKGAA